MTTTLFRAHLADLLSVFPGDGNEFVCPICLEELPVEATQDGRLTDGHVWPKDIRSRAKAGLARTQRVLLCKACNSSSGSRGDSQMQRVQKEKEAASASQPTGDRCIQVVQDNGQEPIEVRAQFAPTGGRTAKLWFDADPKSGLWKRNNPVEQERFLALVDCDELLTVIVHPDPGVSTALARTGWLTAAYLLAFYSLGYRYIANHTLHAVREHIVSSFQADRGQSVLLPQLDDIYVRSCGIHYNDAPRIELIIPVTGQVPVHLEVSFLDYHVGLPFHCPPEPLMSLILRDMPDLDEKMPDLKAKGASLRTPISCAKRPPHDCLWDYIMGKPWQ